MPRKRYVKKTIRTKIVRVKKTPKISYSGNLAITRHTSLSGINGCQVDGAWLQKQQNNFLFQTSNNGGVVNYGSMTFMCRLIDIWNYSELTVLYDQYRIDKVKLRLIPYATMAASGAAVSPNHNQGALIMHYMIDGDDVTMPSNSESGVNEMRERRGYKSVNLMSKMGKPITISFRPRIATDAYAGGVYSAPVRNSPFTWCDCNDASIEGYGFKAIFETISSGAVLNTFFKGEATYYLRFKENR